MESCCSTPTLYVPICWLCKHCSGDVLPKTCASFPDGIPPAILMNRHDYCRSHTGDCGLRFEPVSTIAPAYVEEIFAVAV